MQAVLSAASQQNLGNNKKTTRGAADKPTTVSTAYIPTPDSTGIVEGFEEFYPPGKWVDPETYIRWSETVDDSVENGLTGTFTYYMDERDQDWLEKNNEEARGEGTSAQGAAASATPTRSGLSRSAKSKGKEPDVPQPFAITEDEFELVMGIFEKVTHDKTEFLHHVRRISTMLYRLIIDFYLVSGYRDGLSTVLRLSGHLCSPFDTSVICKFHCAFMGTPADAP